MKNFKFINSVLAVIILLLSSTNLSYSLDRIDMTGIIDNGHYVTVYFNSKDNDPNQLDAIRIYEAEGYTSKQSDFSLIREYDFTNYPNGIDSINWSGQFNSLFTIKSSNFPDKKQMSYYMTAVSGQNESEFPSDSIQFYYSKGPKDSLIFATNPPTKKILKLGETYEYDANAYSLLQNTVKYKLINPTTNDVSINEETGLMTFIANEKGSYSFRLRAYLESDESTYVDQSVNIQVVKCSSLLTCNLTINNTVPNDIANGQIDIYVKNKDSVIYLSTASISPNGYMIAPLDEGQYKLYFRGTIGNNYVTGWYEGKDNIGNADFINTQCDDTLNLTWNIEYTNTTNYSIKIERISAFPQDVVKKGSVYEKKIEYTTNPEGENVVFDLSNKTHFSLTGPDKDILTLNTSKAGVYEVAVYGKMENYPSVKTTDFVRVWVTECDELQTLTVNVRDILTDEILDKPVYGELYTSGVNENDTTIKPIFVDSSYVSNGELEFIVDKGDYYLELYFTVKLNDNQYLYYRYQFDNDKPVNENAKIQEGKLLSVLCENTEIDWKIRNPKDVMTYSISGSVTDENTGEPVKWSLVQLLGKNDLTDEIKFQSTYTNDNGFYTITASDDHEYVISATTADTLPTNRYLREYWEETSNAAEATKFHLNSDKHSIDFTLEEAAEYSNSLIGTINDENGDPISMTPVIAYLVETTPFNSNWLYVGKSSYTDVNGQFKFENLIPGKYIIYSYINNNKYKPGYYSGESNKLVQSWLLAQKIDVGETGDFGDIEVNLEELKAGNTEQIVKGKVEKLISVAPGSTNASAPINGVQVIVTDESGDLINYNYSDKEGEFEVPNVGTGVMRVYFDKVGYKISEQTIEIETGENEATVLSTMEPISTSSVDEFVKVNASIFPNPTSGNVNISGDFVQGNYTITVVDMSGNTLITKYELLNKDKNYSINLSDLNSGKYIIKIEGDNNSYSTKINVIK